MAFISFLSFYIQNGQNYPSSNHIANNKFKGNNHYPFSIFLLKRGIHMWPLPYKMRVKDGDESNMRGCPIVYV